MPLGDARPIDEAISTAGGVRRDGLDDGLMLRARPGVFCAGEMLDWDAPTGGYLLTACLATGRHAGRGAAAVAGGRGFGRSSRGGAGGPSGMTTMERHGTAIAVVVFLVVAVAGILARPLLPVDETRYLAVAWEMREGGHWLVPRLNGEIYSHKPPLLFWLINLVWLFTGVSEFAGRLVGPAFGAASIVATAALARRLWPEDARVGGRAALVLAGTLPFTLYAGLTMFDTMLTLATVLGMTVLARPGPRAWVWLGAALAFGAYAKGPVILIHLVPAALLAPLWTGERWAAAALRLAKAVGVGLVLVGLWLGAGAGHRRRGIQPRGAVDAERRAHGRLLRPRARGVVLRAAAADPALAVDVVRRPLGRAAPRQPSRRPRAPALRGVGGGDAAALQPDQRQAGRTTSSRRCRPWRSPSRGCCRPGRGRGPPGSCRSSSGWRSSPSGSASGRRRSHAQVSPDLGLAVTGLLLVGLAVAGLVAARAGGGAARAGLRSR